MNQDNRFDPNDNQNTKPDAVSNPETDTNPARADELRNLFGPGFTPVPRQELKHSGPGIASFILSLAAGLVVVSMFVAIAVAAKDFVGPQGQVDVQGIESSAASFAMLSLGMLAGGIGFVIGLVLGIIGLVQKERKKVFALLGTIFNALPILGFVMLLLLGLVMSAAAG